jgi:hypothetical protein
MRPDVSEYLPARHERGPNAASDNRAVLILNGWVDWADGSTFLAAAQERKGGLVAPCPSGALPLVLADIYLNLEIVTHSAAISYGR